MKNIKYSLLAALLMLFVSTSHAADETLYFSITEAMKSEDAQNILDPSIRVSFASGGGKIVKAGLISNKKTNGVGKTDEASCQRAFLSAVKSFQDTARKNNANKVINLVSFYKKQTYKSTSQFECHVGNIMTGVALKGDIAR